MKCDELKDYDYDPDFHFQSRGRFYDADEVDAAIDELKSTHHKERHEYIKMIAELKQKLQDQCISCPVKMQEDDVVAELKQELEDAKASAYAESVDAGMENRRLKRALWLARAISAINAVGEIHNVIVCMRERHPKMSLSNTEAQEQVWKNVARKCRAKAEEYK